MFGAYQRNDAARRTGRRGERLAAGGVRAGRGAAQEATVSGLVFEDRDGSGAREPSQSWARRRARFERPRRRGHRAPDGRYVLPLPDEATIFVVKPAGFMPPVDPRDQSAALLSPSPAQGLAGRAQSHLRGPRADRAAAGLGRFPAETPGRAEGVRRRDVRPTRSPRRKPKSTSSARMLIEALAGTEAQFGLTAGDIMFDDLSLYPRYNAIIGTIGLPWWNIGGNHDLNFEAPGPPIQPRDLQALFRPELLRVLLRAGALPHA